MDSRYASNKHMLCYAVCVLILVSWSCLLSSIVLAFIAVCICHYNCLLVVVEHILCCDLFLKHYWCLVL